MTTTGGCPFCGSTYERVWQVRERQFGGDGTFLVGECGSCPALILLNPPKDPSTYYPAEYPAFNVHKHRWRRPLRHLRNRLLLGRRGRMARLVGRFRPHAATRFLERTGATPESRVLDVGSGAGILLHDLADAGFRNLVGVDRFIPEPMHDPRHRVIKGTIDDIHEEFDLVMLHHSLEHMRDQRAALAGAARVLTPAGWCVIRVPVFPSAAWDAYHEHWFQLDMPRHEYIHSVGSLTTLAAEAGLVLDGVEYDSTAHQYAGSEGYKRGFKLQSTEHYFSKATMKQWAQHAMENNASGRGDQAIFYFRKPAEQKG